MSRGCEWAVFQTRHTDGQQTHETMFNITNHQGNANQTTWGITSHLSEWLLPRQQITSVGEDVEKREPLCTIGGNVNCCSHYGKQYGDSSKN